MSLKNGLLGAFILFPLFTSCGKQDLLTNVDREFRKGISDSVSTLHKGFNDTVITAQKAVSDTNETVKKGLTDVKRETDKGLTNTRQGVEQGSHDAVYYGGKFIENVGQIPRNLVNKALGTNEDTDENLHDLEKEVDNMYREFLEDLAELSSEMDDMKIELQGENQALQDIIDDVHTSLIRQIRQGDRRNLNKIRRLKNQLSNLRRNVRTIRRHVNSLEVVCEYDDFLWSVDFATYCELESNNNR